MICKRLTSNECPTFPKRAIITAGMPYGNKDLHFGHVGGMFIHADIFARFLRDRIGKENVFFFQEQTAMAHLLWKAIVNCRKPGIKVRLRTMCVAIT